METVNHIVGLGVKERKQKEKKRMKWEVIRFLELCFRCCTEIKLKKKAGVVVKQAVIGGNGMFQHLKENTPK